MKKLLLVLLLSGCKKTPIIDAVSLGAKLSHADAGKVYQGTWWSENFKDSLVISFKEIKSDSVYYFSNMPEFDGQLTHVIGFEPKDDNLILKNNRDVYSFRRER